ncbi:14407_t:CDS:2, partial [Entrophospora sp. SA101]
NMPKSKELKKFSDEELLTEITLRSKSKKGLPMKEKCFRCKEDFWIKHMAESKKILLEKVTEQVKDKISQSKEDLENSSVFQNLLKNSMIVDESNFLITVWYGSNMAKKPSIQKGRIHKCMGSFEGWDIICPKCRVMYLFQKNDEPEPIHDEEECLKVRSKCSACQTVFNEDSEAILCGEGVGYVCQSCYIPPYDGVNSGARSNAPSSNSYTGEEGRCPECKSVSNFAKGENNPPSAFKCKDEKSCLQLQKDKLKELQEKTSRTEEEQTEMIRLGNKLGVDIKYPRGSESDKKELEEKINNSLKGLKAWKQLPKNHPGFSEYDRQQVEKKLTELKKEYKSKYGELPQLEAIVNRTSQQERELQEKREELSRLENQQQRKRFLKNNMLKSKLPNSQILTQLLQRFTQQELADIYGVNERTIRRNIKPSNKPKQKRGIKEKIVGDNLNLLLSFTDYKSQHNTLTHQEMADMLKEKAIDECHFYLNEAPRYGYAPKSQRTISPAPGSKGGSYSLIIWVKNGKEGDFLVMDNASFHRAPCKRKELGLSSIEEQLSLKNSKLFSLPTHSPQLNPAELLFNTIRHNIEKSQKRHELRKMVTKTINMNVNPEINEIGRELLLGVDEME